MSMVGQSWGKMRMSTCCDVLPAQCCQGSGFWLIQRVATPGGIRSLNTGACSPASQAAKRRPQQFWSCERRTRCCVRGAGCACAGTGLLLTGAVYLHQPEADSCAADDSSLIANRLCFSTALLYIMHTCMHCAADGLAGVWHGWPSLHVTRPVVAVRIFARRFTHVCCQP
jgi:hypothetical protein